MPHLPETISKAADFAKRGLVLLAPGTRVRWIALIGLAIFVGLLEAATATLVFVLLTVVMAPGSPIVVPLLGDVSNIFPSLDQPERLLTACAVIAVFFVFRAGIYVLQSFLQNRLAYQTSALLSARLLHSYLSLPYLDFIQKNSAMLLRNAHESTISFASWALIPAITLAAESLVVLFLCIILLLTSPLVAGTAILFLGVLVIILLRIVQPRLHALGIQVQTHSELSLRSLQQTLHGLREIRLAGKEKYFESEFEGSRRELSKAHTVRGLLIDAPRIALETSVLLVLILFVMLQVSRAGGTTTGLTSIGMFGYVALRVLPSVNRIVNSLQSVRFAVPLVNQLYEDVRAAQILSDDIPNFEPLGTFSSIALDGVGVTYPGGDRPALEDITIEIRRGEKIGIVGETGGGKSTLLDVILGILDPDRGSVLINGVPLYGRKKSWQSIISVVPQSTFLIDDSIERNIALGIPADQINKQALQKAVQASQLESFIASLPDGLATRVGERGVRLSGGQRQRLAIARALYRQPSVLVLDEGTSALDNRTETNLITSLASLNENLTIISVAHRISSIQEYARILVLSEGRLVAEGSFGELSRKAEFRALLKGATD